jgi:hypothetical protein
VGGSLLRFVARLEDIVVGRGRQEDERRKRVLLALTIAIAGPAACIYALVDLAAGRWPEGLAALGVAGAQVIFLPFLGRARDIVRVFRVIISALLLLMAFEVAIGGGDGYAFLWFYFLPFLIFYITGTREGFAWVGLSVAMAGAVMLGGLGPHAYPFGVGVRFLVTFLILSVLSWGLESSRRHWYTRVKEEKEVLADALAQVKTLRGLLPVCASCKRVRDDQGYWTMLDEYLQDHSDIDITHGLCPDCSKALYPQFSDENTPDGSGRE